MQANWEMMRERVIAWFILLFLVLVWGSSFILIKKSLEVFSPVQLGALRILLAALALVPFGIKRIHKVKPSKWVVLAIAGILGNGAPAFLFAAAQKGIDSSVTGILNSLTTLFTLLVGILFFKFKARPIHIIGVFIGLTGAVLLIIISGNGHFQFNFSYASLILVATICYAFNVNIIKTYLNDFHPVRLTTYAFMFMIPPVAIILFGFTDFSVKTIYHPHFWTAFGYISILSLVGTALAMVLFNRLVQLTNSVFAASVTYMIPVVAVMWGVLDGEPFNLLYFFCTLMILTGVYLVNRKKSISN